MKATGIIRYMDDLGRIVIPKELRLRLHITWGDPIEMFLSEEGDLVLRKYNPYPNVMENLQIALDLLECEGEHSKNSAAIKQVMERIKAEAKE